MKQLIKFKSDWADEFTVEAFAVRTLEEVEELFTLAVIYFEVCPGKELEVGFGTNEDLTFSDYKDFRNCFEVFNLDDNEVKVFQKYFYYYLPENPTEFGTGSGVFDPMIFFEEFFRLYEDGELPEKAIEELNRIEPEFEVWLKSIDDEKNGNLQ
jgi:hypothetical protein